MRSTVSGSLRGAVQGRGIGTGRPGIAAHLLGDRLTSSDWPGLRKMMKLPV